MSISKSPVTEWYVTEYPVEGSFAVTDGYEIFATIIGGKTIGDECDLASRIAKLPDLERERDEAREKYLKEKEELDKTLDELVEARGRIAGISGQLLCSASHVGKLEKENAKLRDIAERIFAAGVGRMKTDDWRTLRAELNQLKEGRE